jgi:hypothetical protein
MKARTASVKTFVVLAAMAGLLMLSGLPEQSVAGEKEPRRLSAAAFEALHRMLRPQPGESRWMEIPWYPSIHEARQKAAAEGKPLFIWAGSGGAPAAGC